MQLAIEHKIGLKTIKAKKIARFIMDTFGYETRIIDNILTSDERQIFYMLEGEGILSTSREQTRLYDGRAWMTHYWQLNTDEIIYYSGHIRQKPENKPLTEQKKSKNPSTIYNTLSEEKWLTRKIIDHDPFPSI
jgi:transcription initiation factor IIE alpha subunit